MTTIIEIIDKLKFDDLGLPIPTNITMFSEEEQNDIYQYLINLDEHQKKAYRIAYQHLGTSFHIMRSNGFQDWKKKKTI